MALTKNFKRFLFNGFLLTATSLAMRAIGVSFNAYISNEIGAEAMGLFTLISTVYGFAITLATSAVGFATTRIVSGVLGNDSDAITDKLCTRTKSVRAVVKKSVLYALSFSILSSAILYFGTDFIGSRILCDIRTVSSLKLLAITLIPLSVSSALGGYFTAVRRVYKNAATQISAQLIRIFVCMALINRFFAFDVESSCVCIVIGGVVSELLSFFLTLIFYLVERKESGNIDKGESKALSKSLRSTALPMAFSAYLRSALLTIEHILIPKGLEKSGATRERSLAAYGTVQSMVFPIVFFPSAILSSFASLLIPEVARANNNAKDKRVVSIINNVFDTALTYAIGTAGIMMFFAFELGDVIYPTTDAGKYIRMIAPLIPVMYLDTATDALLKGLGEQVYTMGINIVDSFLSVVLVIILLPRFGIVGYIITVYFTELVNATLSITRLLSISDTRPSVKSVVLKPLFCVILSAYISKFISNIFSFCFISSAFSLIFNITVTASIYVALVIFTKGIKISKKSKKLLK